MELTEICRDSFDLFVKSLQSWNRNNRVNAPSPGETPNKRKRQNIDHEKFEEIELVSISVLKPNTSSWTKQGMYSTVQKKCKRNLPK